MRVSTEGILAYGYNLGGGQRGWEIEEADEHGSVEPGLADEHGDVEAGVEKRLLAAAGFTETDVYAAGYYDRKREAKARVAAKIETYCSRDRLMYILATHVIAAERGKVEPIDWAALDALRIAEDWDGKLRHACDTLGITPKQSQPGWLLASYWG